MAANVTEVFNKTNFNRNNFPASVVKDPECPFSTLFEAVYMKRLLILVLLVVLAGILPRPTLW